jgi:GMP synthase (glutamine-hydrolysing)
MVKPILILKNEPRENPGLIEILLKEHNLEYRIVEFNDSTVVDPVENYSALIVLGGPASANDKTLKIHNEITLVKGAISKQIPGLGICLGLQVIVKALGGTVIKCKEKEVGFRDKESKFYQIKLTPEGRKDRLFTNLPGTLNVFQLHGEMVQLTPDMTLLATGNLCENQIAKTGQTVYGIQSHFELTDELLETWIKGDSDLQELDADKLRSDFETVRMEYQATGRQIFTNFLSIAGII